MSDNPRLGVIGTGAIGGFYGMMLLRAGFDVHFLLRSEYRVVAESGLLIRSRIFWQPACQKSERLWARGRYATMRLAPGWNKINRKRQVGAAARPPGSTERKDRYPTEWIGN
jgi:hypothetical protein